MASLIVPIAGDSNSINGESLSATPDDVTNSSVLMLNIATVGGTPATRLAKETDLEGGTYGQGSGSGGVFAASTFALCKALLAAGLMPSGYDNVILVPTAWAGTAFLNYWATTGNRYALDGGGGRTHGFYDCVNAALGLSTGNRIWFFDWGHGMNDGGQTQTQYQNNMLATWGEIRSTLSGGAAYAPILVTGGPPDRIDPDLGAQTNLSGVFAAQAAVESYLPNSYYVDPTGLHSYCNNRFVHFSAASHRGGVDNSSLTSARYANSSWLWDAGTAYLALNSGVDNNADYVIASDNWCYRCISNSTGNDPTTDGGVHWKKTDFQYGQTVSNPLSARKLAKARAFRYQMRAPW